MKNAFDRVAGLNFVETKNGIYVSGSTNNAISRISPDNSTNIVLTMDEESQSIQQVCWAKSARMGHKILFSPCYGGTFILYDEENDSLRKIEIELETEEENPQGWFWEVTTYGRFFYVLGLYYPGVIRIDSESGGFFSLKDWVEGFYDEVELSSDETKYYFLDGCVRYGDEFYFSTARRSSLLKVDMLTETHELIELGCGVEMIWSISADGDDIWMCDSSKGKIAIWNRITGKINTLELSSNGFWYAPVFWGDWAYLLPVSNEAGALRIHKGNLRVESWNIIDRLFLDIEPNKDDLWPYKGDTGERVANVLMVQQEGERVTFIRRPDYTWFTYDFETDELTSAVYEITDEEYLKALERDYYTDVNRRMREENVPLFEEQVSLEEYLNRLHYLDS